jgi:hypothetical protein
LGKVDFRRRFRNRYKKQSSVHGWGPFLVAKGNFVKLLARCSRLECELPHKSRNKQAAQFVATAGLILRSRLWTLPTTGKVDRLA